MKTKIIPLWYKQILYQKQKNIISYGLTLPFLIGSYLESNQSIEENYIDFLLKDIIEADINDCAVMQLCPNIRQYVIGIDDREFCERYMKGCTHFTNSQGKKTLYITLSAQELGKDIDTLIKSLNYIFNESLQKAYFSWDNRKKEWVQFDKNEKDLIKEALLFNHTIK